MAKKKKYGNRTLYAGGTKVAGYIDNPSTALTENDINIVKAKSKAANNIIVTTAAAITLCCFIYT